MCSADGFEPVDIHWISRWSPASANLLVLIISIDNGGTTNVKIYLSMIAQVESNLLSYLIFSIPNIKNLQVISILAAFVFGRTRSLV